MDDFFVFTNAYNNCLNNLRDVLLRCEETKRVLNSEKCHFTVEEGIVLGHRVSAEGLQVDKARIKVIEKLPPPTKD